MKGLFTEVSQWSSAASEYVLRDHPSKTRPRRSLYTRISSDGNHSNSLTEWTAEVVGEVMALSLHRFQPVAGKTYLLLCDVRRTYQTIPKSPQVSNTLQRVSLPSPFAQHGFSLLTPSRALSKIVEMPGSTCFLKVTGIFSQRGTCTLVRVAMNGEHEERWSNGGAFSEVLI